MWTFGQEFHPPGRLTADFGAAFVHEFHHVRCRPAGLNGAAHGFQMGFGHVHRLTDGPLLGGRLHAAQLSQQGLGAVQVVRGEPPLEAAVQAHRQAVAQRVGFAEVHQDAPGLEFTQFLVQHARQIRVVGAHAPAVRHGVGVEAAHDCHGVRPGQQKEAVPRHIHVREQL